MDCFGARETRSYLASVVSTEANEIVNLPCLKEHNASCVTGCLKIPHQHRDGYTEFVLPALRVGGRVFLSRAP